jgi:flagellar biosynthesis/type III secretory pathway M-ring protein FliF/YscJ
LIPAATGEADAPEDLALTAERQAVLLTDDGAGVAGYLSNVPGGQERLANAAGVEGMGGAQDAFLGHASEAQGRIPSSLMDEVSQMIERQPEDAVRVLRAWLQG